MSIHLSQLEKKKIHCLILDNHFQQLSTDSFGGFQSKMFDENTLLFHAILYKMNKD